MLKDVPNWRYEYDGKKLSLRDLYGKLKKKRGNARIKARAVVRLSNGEEARIIFVPSEKKRRWFPILSTDIEMAEEEIVRLYGKRWDIEVFFKMCKQHLKLVEEIQIRDFDGLIAHTSMVFARYNILSWLQRQRTDGQSFDGMFRLCWKEMGNIKFIGRIESDHATGYGDDTRCQENAGKGLGIHYVHGNGRCHSILWFFRRKIVFIVGSLSYNWLPRKLSYKFIYLSFQCGYNYPCCNI